MTYGLRPKWLPSFVPNRGRDITAQQARLFDELAPNISLSWNESDTPQSCRARWIGDHQGPVWAELGFGAGEHLVLRAETHPDTLCIGVEPFTRGVASLLSSIHAKNLQNIRLYQGDGRLLLEQLPDASLDGIDILFPDPWPKTRHNKRRIISLESLALFSRLLKPGGELLLATDIHDYAIWMLERLLATPSLQWQANTMQDILTPPALWTTTRYQAKAIREGRPSYYIQCKKQ